MIARIATKASCLIFFLVLSCTIKAQLAADFSATPTDGCAPLVVRFTDLSTGSPTSWKWDLGNGTISFLQNPAVTYFNPGNYTVKLVIKKNNLKDSVVKTQYIHVRGLPTVDFTSDVITGCYPLAVQFTDQSIAGSGSITSWQWDFGDGNSSTLQNPSHVYTSSGNFNVTLQVHNTYGCQNSIVKTSYIFINNGVYADFTNSIPNSCSAPVTIDFTNATTGTGTINYQWDFGDGTTSNLTNPTHTYSQPGSYNVMLVGVNGNGCSDTIIKPNAISIGAVVASFTSADTICKGNPLVITNTSSPTPGAVNWDFGDGTTSTNISPVQLYNAVGTYNILMVANFGACVDSVTKRVTVLPVPTADFISDDSTSCTVPFTVHFNNHSHNGTTYAWDFGDGTTSNWQTPHHTYTSFGNYNVLLIVTNAQGCQDTIIKTNYISIQKPIASITNAPDSGCAPFTKTFHSSVNTVDSVVGYSWDFGDGTTSTDATPVHTYTNAGVYPVSLVITTVSGCMDTVTVPNAIIVTNVPVANFYATPLMACAKDTINFFDSSTGGVTHWQWTFGDGGSSVQQNPRHVYHDTGYFQVQLVAWNSGCPDTLIIPNYIYINPPVAKFQVAFDCKHPYDRQFNDHSVGADEWDWDFGDGTTSNDTNPFHTFPATGTYTITLRVVNYTTGCDYTTTKKIFIVDTHAFFTTQDSVTCKNNIVTFTTGLDTTKVNNFKWDFGDGITFITTANSVGHTYTQSGTYNVTLVITNILGCKDTLTIPNVVTIYGPTANFAPGVVGSCLNTSVPFTDNSTTDGIHPIVSWEWNFGDGTTQVFAGPPFQHSYASAGSYTVSLKVTDSRGCVHSYTYPLSLLISKPVAGFLSHNAFNCPGKNVGFTNTSTGPNLTYDWDFGDNTPHSNVLNPFHAYAADGFYTVTLSIVDQYGCTDVLTMPNFVHIVSPLANFSMSDSVTTCPPLLVQFSNLSANVTAKVWDFGDGTTSTINNPSHFYSYPGVYPVKLKITSAGGCTDTIVKFITIHGPRGTFKYDPLTGCAPVNINYHASLIGQTSIIWDFSDGTTLINNDTLTSHQYIYPGVYLPKMILEDSNGCQVPIIGKDTVSVNGVYAWFNYNNRSYCDSAVVNFSDTSVSNDLITTYQWTFGDGSTSNQTTPTHQYHTPGQYYPSVIISTLHGCTDTVTADLPIKVSVSPKLTMNLSANGCIPLTATMDVTNSVADTAAIQWNWNFGNGNTYSLQHPPTQVFNTAGIFNIHVSATNSLGCADSVQSPIEAYAGVNAAFNFLNKFYCDSAVINFADSSISTDNITTHNWTFGDGSTSNQVNPTHLYTNPGQYSPSLIVSTIHGCADTIATNLPIKVSKSPKLTLNLSGNGCAPLSANMDASNAVSDTAAIHWFWTFGNGTTYALQHPPVQIYTTAGVFNVQVAAINSLGCSDSVARTIEAYAIPIVNAGADTLVCNGKGIVITATGADNYSWSPALGLSCTNCSSPTVSPSGNSSYIVKGTTIHGCTNADTVQVRVKQSFTMRYGKPDVLCKGKSANLYATGADFYEWSPSTGVNDIHSATPTITPDSTTNYRVIGTDSAGCFKDTGYVFLKVYPIPTVDAGPDVTVHLGNSVDLVPTISNDVTSVIWSPTDNLFRNDYPGITVKPTQTTEYTVNVANAGGCTASDRVSVFVICNGGNVFIPNTFSPNGDGKNDVFYPRGTGLFQIKSLKVFDRWGEIVFEQKDFAPNDPSKGWDGTFKGRKLNSDVFIYTIDVVCDNGGLLSFKGDIALIK